MVADKAVPSSGKRVRYRPFGKSGVTAMVVEVLLKLMGLMWTDIQK